MSNRRIRKKHAKNRVVFEHSLHTDLWEWVALTGLQKRLWPGWNKHPESRAYLRCFACRYASRMRDIVRPNAEAPCCFCPLRLQPIAKHHLAIFRSSKYSVVWVGSTTQRCSTRMIFHRLIKLESTEWHELSRGCPSKNMYLPDNKL